jgi:hypothetical protein
MAQFEPSPESEHFSMDFLTPEQRVNAVAGILATIALRIVKSEEEADHEQDQD